MDLCRCAESSEHAGPEVGVASTKAFTAQLTALVVLAHHLGEVRGTLSTEDAKNLMKELTRIPGKLESLLNRDEEIEKLANQYHRVQDFYSWAAASTTRSR